MLLESANIIKLSGKNESSCRSDKTLVEPSEDFEIQDVGDMSPEAQEYVRKLQSRLLSVKKVCQKHSN